MSTWIRKSPFRAAGHLHLRQLARLPAPDQPDRDLGAQPARRGLAPDADHARAAGLLLDALPALRQEHRPDDQPEHGQHLRRGPRPGRRSRRDGPSQPPGALGIVRGSTLFYDLEAFEHPALAPPATARRCGSSAAGPRELHRYRYASGVYSSAASGIRMLDDPGSGPATGSRCPTRSGSPTGTARRTPARRTSAATGGSPTAARKQYQGGHHETWGGVTDQHRPQLPRPAHPEAPRRGARPRRLRRARPSRRATGDTLQPRPRSARRIYRRTDANTRAPGCTTPLQCLLKQQRRYGTRSPGSWNAADAAAALHAYQRRSGTGALRLRARPTGSACSSAGNSGAPCAGRHPRAPT